MLPRNELPVYVEISHENQYDNLRKKSLRS